MLKIDLCFAITGNRCHWLQVSRGVRQKFVNLKSIFSRLYLLVFLVQITARLGCLCSPSLQRQHVSVQSPRQAFMQAWLIFSDAAPGYPAALFALFALLAGTYPPGQSPRTGR